MNFNFLKVFSLAALLPMLSCGVIAINQNGFADISSHDRAHFYPFNPNDIDRPVNYADSCSLQRITSRELSMISNKHSVIWVQIFAPWCKGVTCEDFGKYQSIAASAGNVKLVMISLSYNYSQLKEKLSMSGIDRMIYVFDTSYSFNHDKAHRTFFAGLKKNKHYPFTPDSYVLRNDTLVYIRDGRKSDAELIAELKQIGDGGPIPRQEWD